MIKSNKQQTKKVYLGQWGGESSKKPGSVIKMSSQKAKAIKNQEYRMSMTPKWCHQETNNCVSRILPKYIEVCSKFVCFSLFFTNFHDYSLLDFHQQNIKRGGSSTIWLWMYFSNWTNKQEKLTFAFHNQGKEHVFIRYFRAIIIMFWKIGFQFVGQYRLTFSPRLTDTPGLTYIVKVAQGVWCMRGMDKP